MPSVFEKIMARVLHALPDTWLQGLAGDASPVVRGRRLDPRLAIAAKAAATQTPLHQMSPGEARTTSTDALALADGTALAMERIDTIAVPGADGDLPARVYHPADLGGLRPLLLYFHQGGCVIGNLDWCHTFCTILAAEARCVVMSVEYRKGPEHRFPAAQDDAVAAYRWAAQHASELGGDPERLAVAGDSAGGGLSAHITQEMRRTDGPQPILQLLVYPWLHAYADNDAYRDFENAYPCDPKLMRWFLTHYLDDDAQQEDTRISPLLEPDLAGLAPAIVAIAGFDPLCDEGEAYAKKLEQAGVPVRFRCFDTLTHSFTSLSGAVPAAREALYTLARDVERAFTGAWP